MNEYIDKIQGNFRNPFLVAIWIVVILNILMFLLLPRAQIPSASVYFRALFYEWIFTVLIFYIHNYAVENEFKSQMNQKLSMDLIRGSSEELKPTIVPETESIFTNDENEFI